jgi:hypothetical protein
MATFSDADESYYFRRHAMSANTPQWNQLFQYEDGQIELTDNREIPVFASAPPRKYPKPNIDQHRDEKQEAAIAG